MTWRLNKLLEHLSCRNKKPRPNTREQCTPNPLNPMEDDGARHDSDDEPMVYRNSKDYATIARQERHSLLAEGADPESVIVQSELHNYVPQRYNDSVEQYTKRYADTIMDMTRRGVRILNDMLTGDTMPDTFETASGNVFDLGPESGSTKGEYREFRRWLLGVQEAEQIEVPEKWLKFEKPGEGKDEQ